jgi:dTMP kinase
LDKGLFITLEGGEGAGKSTQVRLLGEALEARGIATLVTREPGGAPGAEHIREILLDSALGPWEPMSEALLHFAARREHLARSIKPTLEAGRWVVSDRFADSTTAYQGYAGDLGTDAITALYKIVLGDFAPDLTLILDLPVTAGLARAAARPESQDRYERMDLDFHERVRAGYLEIARQEPERCVLIDADGNISDTHDAILAAVEQRFPVGEGTR